MLQKAADIQEKGTETMCTIQDIVYFFAILFVKHKIWRKRNAQISHGGKIFYARKEDRGLSGVNLYAI